MFFLRKLFKRKKKEDQILSENKKINQSVQLNEDNMAISSLLEKYNKFENFIKNDKYISRKEFNKFLLTLDLDINFYNNLEKNNVLSAICNKEKYSFAIAIIEKLNNSLELVENHNTDFIKNKIVMEKDYFDNILKECDPNIILDDDQRTCVLVDEDYCLVIAGAGAGKTTTVAAKVKYLVEKQNIKPEDILVISFTNKAVDELKERINKQLGIECLVTTFHSTGVDIIKKDSPDKKINPTSNGFMYNAVRDFLRCDIIKDKVLLDKLMLFFGEYFESPFTEGDLKNYFTYLMTSDFSTLKSNLGEYNKILIDKNTNKCVTIQSEIVKSHQEVQIANFLYTNNLYYEYEPVYPVYMPGSSKYYTPDFLIIQNNKMVYLEHFALSEDYKNSRFNDSEIIKYKKAISDKIALHQKYGTKLIVTWSKYNDGLSLLEHLKAELIKAGFELKPRSSQEIFAKLNKTENENKYYTKLTKLLCSFIEKYKINGYNESTFAVLREKIKNVRTKLFLDIVEGAYLYYENKLHLANLVDFSDMINESARLLNEKAELHQKLSYKYVIVDEYQDISRQRFDLIKALSNVCDAKIIAVGDDWQSIYAFSGSDLSLFTHFKEKMGYAKELKITRTYRNAQEVIDIAGGFIQENNAQIKKRLVSLKHINKPVIISSYRDDIEYIKQNNMRNETEARASMIEDAIARVIEYNEKEGKSDKSSILLIGRYNFEADKLGKTRFFTYDEQSKIIKSNKYPNINLSFLTAHSSKGLGYDNVIIINAIDATYGFPSQIEDDPVISIVQHNDRTIEYAEERRLFYVALTRTKNRVFIVAPETQPSKFILELKENYKDVVLEGKLKPKIHLNDKKLCPICGYPLKLSFNDKYGIRLYMCTNDQELCGFMTNNIHGGKMSICKCDNCKDGFLIVRHSHKTGEYFLGCTNYYTTVHCERQMSKQEFCLKNGIDNSSFNVEDLLNKKVVNDFVDDSQTGEVKLDDSYLKTSDVKSQEEQSNNVSDDSNCQKSDGNFKHNTVNNDIDVLKRKFQNFYDDLYDLRNKHNTIYKELFYVLPEAVIYDIYLKQPLDEDDLINIHGIGETRFENMGDDVLYICNKYIELKNLVRPPVVRKEDKYQQIGTKWTDEEDNKLIEEFKNGKSVTELASIHGRTRGAIRSRLRKLGVVD